MNLLDLVRKRADGHRVGEDVPWDTAWPDDREKLWVLLGEAEALKKAATDLEATLKAELAATLRENESIRLGETVYKTSPNRNTKIVDVVAFAEWLGDDWHFVVPFSPSTGNSLKVRGLAAVCERRGVDLKSVQDTFTETEWGDPKLVAIPISKAPKSAQGLKP